MLFSADQLVQPDRAFLSYITVPIATKWCYTPKKNYGGATIANAWVPQIDLDFPTEFVENMNAKYFCHHWEWRLWFQVDWDYSHPSKFVQTSFPSVCLRKHYKSWHLMTESTFTACSALWPKTLHHVTILTHWAQKAYGPTTTQCHNPLEI